jgi:TolA-binding protein
LKGFEEHQMNPVDSYQKQLRGELANVEKEITSHNQQIDALNLRLEALKRALELFESDQFAVAELLRTADPKVDGLIGKTSAAAAKAKSIQHRAPATEKRPPGTRSNRAAPASALQNRPPAGKTARDGLKRIDMLSAALEHQPGMSVRELMAALARQFAWRPAESGVTNLLYTNPDKFARSKPDRSTNRPVTWALRKK